MRDAFIGRLSNSSIRQRLLKEEEEELHFRKALNEILNRAQQQSHSFIDSNPVEKGKLEYSVFLLLEVSTLFDKNAIFVERSLTASKFNLR